MIAMDLPERGKGERNKSPAVRNLLVSVIIMQNK